MVATARPVPRAVEAWVAPRKGEVDRIRVAIHEIATSGLTLSKLTVAASLLGDLVKSLKAAQAADRPATKKNPKQSTRLGFLSCCLNLGLWGRAAGCRGMGEPPGRPS